MRNEMRNKKRGFMPKLLKTCIGRTSYKRLFWLQI